MKHGFLLAMLVAVAGCDDKPQAQSDGGGPAGEIDALAAVDASPPDVQSPDVAADAGADVGEPDAQGPAIDGAIDVEQAADTGAPDTGGGADAGSDGPAPGAMCGTASRESLCATYCDGIGRFCAGGARQYASADACKAACNAATWACGKQGETTGNSLFCRLAHTALAGVGSATAECANAGPRSPACQ